MITCGWCNTHYQTWRSKCDACGGPMPPPPGQELGPPPPEVPRALPSGYAFRTRFFNLSVLLGIGFSGFSGLFLIQVLKNGQWLLALLPGFFLLGGLSCLRYGWSRASGILRAFRRGIAVPGKVASVCLDTTQSVNQKHPWKLTYHFTLDGRLYEGVITSFDSTLAQRAAGQPLWVLYVEKDPTQNTIYPPLKYF